MEGQIQSAPAPQQAPAPSGGGSSISSNHILLTVLGGIVAGFAVGIGFILAQKAMKKNIVVQSDVVSSMNGMPMGMYPPRNQNQRPMNQRPPQQYGQSGYMRFDGVEDNHKFDLDCWIKAKNEYTPKEMDGILAEVKD